MNKCMFNYIAALLAGMLLALMIACNSRLASYSSPLAASWLAHAIGAITAFFLLFMFTRFYANKTVQKNRCLVKTPIWAYLGGVPGALTVVLAALSVNSSLGLSSSLALMFIGKVLFGLVCDSFGLFGVKKRGLSQHDVMVVMLILIGSAMIIYFRTV